MTSRRWLALWLLTLATLGICLLLLSDWLPFLRGPVWYSGEWRWPHFLRPLERWQLPILASLSLLGVSAWWLRKSGKGRSSMVAGLLGLVAANLFLQGSLVYADRPMVMAEAVDRNLALQTSGYFRTAAEIEDLGAVLSSYSSQMPEFDSEHARTHPPGLVMGNWLIIRSLDSAPSLSASLANWIRPMRCTDLWVLDSPDEVLAGLAVSSVLAPLAAALCIPLAYALGRQIAEEAGARLATITVATLPALVLFTPLADQMLAFLSLSGLLLLVLAQRHRSTWLYFATGVVISAAAFASLGTLALLLLVGVVLITQFWAKAEKRKDVLKWVGALTLGLGILWIGYWVLWGIAPWEMAQSAMEQHYELVTSRRQYGVWLGFNLVDLMLFAGTAVIFGAVGALLLTARQLKERSLPAAGSLTLGLAVLIVVLLLSGTTRGEVGRIWLFFLPLLAISAGNFLADWAPGQRATLLLVGLQLALGLSLGLAWRPVEAVIVRAERPIVQSSMGPVTHLEATFEEGIRLTGYSVASHTTRPGEEIGLSLIWQSDGPTRRPYTVFAHVVDASGNLISQQDGWPVNGQWPPTCWQGGEEVIDPIKIDMPRDAAAGTYWVSVGLYDAGNGQRLRLANGNDAVEVMSVEVAGDG